MSGPHSPTAEKGVGRTVRRGPGPWCLRGFGLRAGPGPGGCHGDVGSAARRRDKAARPPVAPELLLRRTSLNPGAAAGAAHGPPSEPLSRPSSSCPPPAGQVSKSHTSLWPGEGPRSFRARCPPGAGMHWTPCRATLMPPTATASGIPTRPAPAANFGPRAGAAGQSPSTPPILSRPS